ncbi:MAG: HNH endonuclease [Dethiobacter sp.]|nr:HNH endonuclease [Dethiobacter sp.]MBS3898702.1 HNH endonuclease [Dethiobacter sp.]
MPMKPHSPCSSPGCQKYAVEGGRCAAHKREPWPGRRGFAGYGTDYKRVRRQVLREEPQCALCGSTASTVDHILPVSRGGGHERTNLRALCKPCHDARSKKQAQKKNSESGG